MSIKRNKVCSYYTTYKKCIQYKKLYHLLPDHHQPKLPHQKLLHHEEELEDEDDQLEDPEELDDQDDPQELQPHQLHSQNFIMRNIIKLTISIIIIAVAIHSEA